MNFKKNWKRFWTLSSAREGFTLVELIVVIAILAILAGVGIPAYSGYVTKANKQADITLISEIEHALTLAYYNGTFDDGEAAYIVLSTNGITAPADIVGSNLEEALIAAFGTNYANTLKLKYDGWNSVATSQVFAEAYLASSYSGNEDALIGQVGSLTNLLKDALGSNSSLVGDQFTEFLEDNEINTNDNQAVSNAAILYAADTISNMSEAQEAAVNTAFQNFYTPGDGFGDTTILMRTLERELGTFGAVAAMYAHGEAFGQYVSAETNGSLDLLTNFHQIDVNSITDPDAALTQVATNLGTLVRTAQTDSTINPLALQYIGAGQYADDVSAYLEAMKTIDANADKFIDNLGSEGCYTDGTAADMLQAAVSAGSLNISCGAGEIAVWIGADGVADNSNCN